MGELTGQDDAESHNSLAKVKIRQKSLLLDSFVFQWLAKWWIISSTGSEASLVLLKSGDKLAIDRKVNRPWTSLEQLSRSHICQKSQSRAIIRNQRFVRNLKWFQFRPKERVPRVFLLIHFEIWSIQESKKTIPRWILAAYSIHSVIAGLFLWHSNCLDITCL